MIKSLLKKTFSFASVMAFATSMNAQSPPNDQCELVLSLDGSTTVSTSGTMDGPSTYSSLGWFKTSTSSTGTIVDYSNNQYFGYKIQVLSDGRLRFQHHYSLNSYNALSNSTVNDGSWHHFAAVKTIDSLFLYIDGIKETAVFSNENYFPQMDFTNTIGSGLTGNIDEISVWSSALSENSIQSHMQNKLAGNESNLTLYYNFNEDENAGTVLNQSSTQRNGSINGTPLRIQPDGSAACVVEVFPPNGNCGTVLNFDGIDDHIITNVGANIFTNQDFTLEAWIYIEEYSNHMASVIFGNRPENEQVLFFIAGEMQGTNKGKLRVQLGTGGTPSESLLGNTVLETQRWYHVAFVYDFTSAGHNANAKLYLNGAEDGSWTGVTDTRIYQGDRVPMENMFIGFEKRPSSPAAYHFNGKMDEVRIWSDVRTGVEIAEYKDSSFVVDQDDLVFAFNFNEGQNNEKVNSIAKPMVYEGDMMNMDAVNSWAKTDGSPVLNTYSEISELVCGSNYSSPSGLTFTSSGAYLDVIPNAAGCDSSIRINLDIQDIAEPTAYINQNNGNFEVGSWTGDSFEWVKCDDPNGQVYSTSNSFDPTETGEYQVRITKNGCSASSNCLEYSQTVSSNQIGLLSNDLYIYPNPTNGIVTIAFQSIQNNVTIEIFDISGSLVHSISTSNTEQLNIDINEEPGVYFMRVSLDNASYKSKRIIKL